MIAPPSGDLERALKDLEPGESWALMPKRDQKNPNIWTPGIKWEVQPGSYTHMTEFFGPILAVLRAENLDHAIELVNQTGYGLTSAIESLDEREQEHWREHIVAGNLYMNRGTTGAIVQRQPFGGMGKSAFGPGIKAGGPNYVAQLLRFSDRSALPDGNPEQLAALIKEPSIESPELRALFDALASSLQSDSSSIVSETFLAQLGRAIASYELAWKSEFGVMHDDVRLLGQDNFRRYLPVSALRIRIHPSDTVFEIYARVCAARIAGCQATLSIPAGYHSPAMDLLDRLTDSWGAAIEFVQESDDELADRIRTQQVGRIRYAAKDRIPTKISQALSTATGIYLASAPVLAEGRLELLWYLQEQSISHDYHRYGNLGARSDETRRSVL